jgi:S-adenosylmethionine:tRNA ribosyltransferase-isomerase
MENTNHSLEDYLYELPDYKIAKFPLQNREDSKLLFYQNGNIAHHQFKEATNLLPKDSLLFFNNTKVISARLIFHKSTGAKIEIFLIEPIAPHQDFQLALKAKKTCTWKCMVGNAKKWKGEVLTMELKGGQSTLNAEFIDKENGLINFTWDSEAEFLEIIESAGHVPLPPYLNREDEVSDKDRYQTVFSKLDGAVAAPTAGLHFTDEIISTLKQQNTTIDYLTLHVSAGTFRPVKAADYTDHEMHNERIIITKQNIENILKAENHIIAVGTTALRTLESTYWYGVKLLKDKESIFHINKLDPYQEQELPSRKEVFEAILKKMEHENVEGLKGDTEIFIFPEYDFKVCSGLFTNYHQPGSTLILLVAAFVGEDWKRIYNSALQNDYRFLSYGDTSLLLR